MTTNVASTSTSTVSVATSSSSTTASAPVVSSPKSSNTEDKNTHTRTLSNFGPKRQSVFVVQEDEWDTQEPVGKDGKRNLYVVIEIGHATDLFSRAHQLKKDLQLSFPSAKIKIESTGTSFELRVNKDTWFSKKKQGDFPDNHSLFKSFDKYLEHGTTPKDGDILGASKEFCIVC